MASRRRSLRETKRMTARRKKRARLLIMAGAGLILIALLGVYIHLRNYVNRVDKNVICDNVWIGTMDVSGMTAKEASAALEEHMESDGAVTVTLEADNGSAQAALSELGLSAEDVDELAQEAVDYGKTGSVFSRYRKQKNLEKEKYVIREKFSLDQEQTEAVLNERAVPLVQGAVDASIQKTATSFEITPEQEGKALDVEATIEAVTDHLNDQWEHDDFAVELQTKKEKPKITEEDLSTIQDELGSFWTDAGGGDRWQNLKNGVDKLNGKILMPGETLSVGQTTGPFTPENGYVEAGAYENGQVVSDYGGGICQVSTTLYNAVIYAELEVVERSPHSMTVAYVKPSRDAAIAGDYLDFKFRNSYDTPIYIYGEINDSNQLRFIIYGKETRPKNRTVEYESETISTEPYGTVYKENTELAAGTTEVTGSPHDGVEAQLWKIVYEDGQEVSREVFNTSHYEKSDQVIEVGTASASGGVLTALQNAIASQDADKVNAAVSQAASVGSEEQAPDQTQE